MTASTARYHGSTASSPIVDTGGWVVGSEDIFEGEINKQVEIAMEEADVILFVVDVESGITDLDDEVAAKLRRTKKPVLLVANKADNFAQHYEAAEFYSFGLGDPMPISAVSGSGTGDLLDAITKNLPKANTSMRLSMLHVSLSSADPTRVSLRSSMPSSVRSATSSPT